jgi:triacylglycerol lipase
VLEANGVEVLIARVPATASIKDRAAILDEFISEKFPGREVNLVGHSMVRATFQSYLITCHDPVTMAS